MNKMKEIRIEKLTINVGTGKEQANLEKGIKLLKNLTGVEPIKTHASKRIPAWGLRPGLPIGCKLTLRGKETENLLKRILVAREHILKPSQIDEKGNVSFGVPEYIDIPGMKYDPKIGIMGFEVCLTLERPGYRVKKRKVKKSKIPKHHLITKKEATEFLKKRFEVKIGDE